MTKYFYLLIFAVIFTFPKSAEAQKKLPEFNLNISAYADTYIATDNDKIPPPWDNEFNSGNSRKLSVVNNLKGEFGINIAQISADMLFRDNIRGKVTVQYGDIPWQAGFSGFQQFSIQEAFAGVAVTDDLWVDAGFFLTHIGSESLVPKDNWLSSHSLVTNYEPFYHSGVRILFDNGTISAGFHILNSAWQFVDNNENKTFGLNLGYEEKDWGVNYAGIIGNEQPGSAPSNTMMLHNFNVIVTPEENFGIKAQFDIGTKENAYADEDGDPKDGTFMGAALQARLRFIKNMAVTGRLAYADNSESAMPGMVLDGFGATIGAEYNPTANSFIRLEGRILSMDKDYEIFTNDDKASSSRMGLMINFGVFVD